MSEQIEGFLSFLQLKLESAVNIVIILQITDYFFISCLRFNNRYDIMIRRVELQDAKAITTIYLSLIHISSTIYKLVRDELKGKGLELRHYGLHSLRHTCATRLINTGHSLKAVSYTHLGQCFCGWVPIKFVICPILGVVLGSVLYTIHWL